MIVMTGDALLATLNLLAQQRTGKDTVVRGGTKLVVPPQTRMYDKLEYRYDNPTREPRGSFP